MKPLTTDEVNFVANVKKAYDSGVELESMLEIVAKVVKAQEELKNAETKTCKLCGNDLPLDNFSKRKQNKDGLNAACKHCVSAWTKEYNANRRREAKKLEAVQNDAYLRQ